MEGPGREDVKEMITMLRWITWREVTRASTRSRDNKEPEPQYTILLLASYRVAIRYCSKYCFYGRVSSLKIRTASQIKGNQYVIS